MKRITWYVGIGVDQHGTRIYPATLQIDHAKRLISDEFGGYTSWETTGGWVSPNGELIEEPALRIETLTPKESDGRVIAQILAGMFNQTAVFLTVENLEGGLVFSNPTKVEQGEKAA